MTVPEPLITQVTQLRAERANAVAYGQKDIVAAVDRQLAALGVVDDERAPEAAVEEARTKAPQGRSAKPKQTTTP